jgi:hypothetical protein
LEAQVLAIAEENGNTTAESGPAKTWDENRTTEQQDVDGQPILITGLHIECATPASAARFVLRSLTKCFPGARARSLWKVRAGNAKCIPLCKLLPFVNVKYLE